MGPRKSRTRVLVGKSMQRSAALDKGPKRVGEYALLLIFATLIAHAQTVTFNAPFTPISQSQVTYGQGIVADAESNLYITGTVNLLYLQRNANGSYTPASTKIDSVGGAAYGLAIDASNNLYRPDIAPGSYPALAKYIYQGVNSFQKYSIGTWSTTNRLSSVAVDSSYNVYVLDAGGTGASVGSIVELTPSSSCSSLPACTSYTQSTLISDSRLYSATGLSLDTNGNFYFTSGPTTGNTPSVVSSSTAAVYKLIPSGSTYAFNALGSNWNSPAATAVDSLGNVWVADYGAQKIYQLVPASSSPSETSYTVTQFQSSTTFACLRTLTVSKTGQLFGLESGGSGCNGSAVPEVGGTPPHSAGTPSVGVGATQEIDVTFSTAQNPVNYRVVTQGSTATAGFSDVTPSSGSTSGGTPYCTEGTGSGYTCAILAQFYPSTPGLEEGAVLVMNSSGAVIGTNYLYGVGYGAQATFAPGQTNTYAASQLLSPSALATDAFSNLYAADPGANLVRLINSAGTASTLAGTGTASTSADASCGGGGLASSTNLTISGLALDGAGNLYLADPNQNRVCAMNLSTGVLSTIAGTGASCSSSSAACGDGGAATSAQLALGPLSGLAVDGLGNLLIADSADNRLRSVNLNTGVIITVAGTGSACSGTAACGDGGLATAAGAYLNNPTAVAVNAAGDYLIADTGDNRIRQISELTSALSTVAGSGTAGSTGDGSLATIAELSSPVGVAVDAAGDLYIADQGNNRVRMVTAGNGNIITLVGGGTTLSASNPTSATSASLNSPASVAVDGNGNVFVADTGDSIIEEVAAGSTVFTFSTVTASGSVDGSDGAQTASLLNIGNVALTYLSPGITTPTDFETLSGNSNDCSLTFSLASGTSCNARVEFYPQSPGSFTESLVFSDNALGGNPATQAITLIGTAANPTITLSPSAALAAAQAGVAYSQTFTASGGLAPYTFAVTSGSLPSGLALSSSGILSGTPTTTSASAYFVITATDSSSASSGGPFSGTGSYALTVNAGAAAKLVASAVASTLVSGGNLGTLTATIEDIDGNSVSNSTASVTLTITGPNGYSQVATATAVNGVASLDLSALALNAAGTYTVTTSSAGLSGTSTLVTVTSGTAAKLATSAVAATLVSGGNLGTLTATVEDTNGNTATSSTALITLTILGPNGYSQLVTATAVNGVASLNLSSLALTAAGSYTVTVSSPGLTGTMATVNVTPGAATQIVAGGIATSVTSGQSLGTATATIEDAYGNTVTSYTGTLAATLTGPNGYSQTVTGTAVNGTVTFNLASLTPTDAGTYALTLTGSGLTSGSAASTAISVAAAPQTIILPSSPSLTFGAGSTTLATTTSAGLPITYSVTGPAVLSGYTLTITGAGTVTITATQAGDASHAAVVATTTFTVAKAASTTALVTSSGVATTGTSVTLTAQVGVPAGTPSGTVAFLDGSTSLGTAAVSSGSATLTLSTLPTGVLSLTAVYSGDANFLSSTSAAVVTDVQDFGIAATAGTPSVPVVPGASATFTLSLTPGAAGFSSSIALKATGLPAGATYSFSPATVTPGSAVASTVLTVQTAKPVATVRSLGGAAGFTLALLGVPFSLSRRARRALNGTRVFLVLAAVLLLGGVAGLTGCGTSNGFFGQAAQSYTVTVTATSGALSHATTVVINVQ